jgi:protein-S-isoprenylcysteine O-methyltransferase Ste14
VARGLGQTRIQGEKRTHPANRAPVRIHTGGPFRFTRNPMYLGIFIGLLGIALLLGSLITFVFPILFFLIMDRAFIPFEEQMLQEALPQEFAQYREKDRRWL